jgi:hypothetical protein
MSKIIATFSSGYTDEYKGKRPVTAAWLITKLEDGSVVNSGHSFDLDAAARTAKSNTPRAMETFRSRAMTPGYYAYIMEHYVRPAGCSTIAQYNAYASAANAAKAAEYKVEIISL